MKGDHVVHSTLVGHDLDSHVRMLTQQIGGIGHTLEIDVIGGVGCPTLRPNDVGKPVLVYLDDATQIRTADFGVEKQPLLIDGSIQLLEKLIIC